MMTVIYAHLYLNKVVLYKFKTQNNFSLDLCQQQTGQVLKNATGIQNAAEEEEEEK